MHRDGELHVLSVDHVHFSLLHKFPAVVERGVGCVERETPHPFVFLVLFCDLVHSLNNQC